MTKKKEEKKEVVVQSKSVARRMAWGGITPQVGKSETDNAKLALFCNQVSEVYGVPSLGVNAMSGQPYLNKDGRLYLLSELRKGKNAVKAIRKEFIQMSLNLEQPAIVKTTIVFADGVEVEAIGEASKQSVKLDAVKQTLNMMAETRSLNRAIWQAISGDVWNRVAENLARMKGVTDEDKSRIMKAGSVSYEEMQQPTASENFSPSNDDEIIADLKAKVDATNDFDTLVEYSIKLSKGKSSKKVKEVLDLYIREKVAKISK